MEIIEPESWKHLPASFGDRVKIRRSQKTEASGFVGYIGIVQGITTPSTTGVPVIGDPTEDTAINVFFEPSKESAWFAPQLVEFLDHNPGATMTLEGVPKAWTRDASGEWVESSRPLPIKEWFAWVRGFTRRMIRRAKGH